ncbi:MAG: segregation/condensation protein A [Prochloraceae cyanobacterium]|nr:segregation/condensation protein A [Prochloraceae cyanobacterium]
MHESPARDAIAFLIDRAQKGDIDPWDVKVIEIIDRFLGELGLIGNDAAENRLADLPKSGQAFLWASMLVLLKADTLEKSETEIATDPELEESQGSESHERRSLPEHLERHLRRRSSAPPLRKRRVTLSELIEQIEKIAKELEEKTTPTRSRRDRSLSRSEAARAIAGLAHNENLTELATQLEQFLASQLPELAASENCIDLEQLLEWWTRSRQANLLEKSHNSLSDLNSKPGITETKDRVGVFWALLLLSAQSKVELLQTEFYQDLKIKPIRGDTL